MKLACYATTILAVCAATNAFSMDQQQQAPAASAAQPRPAWVHPGPTTAENNPATPIQGVGASGQTQGAIIDEGGNLKMVAPAQKTNAAPNQPAAAQAVPVGRPPVVQPSTSAPSAMQMQPAPAQPITQGQVPQGQMPQGQMPPSGQQMMQHAQPISQPAQPITQPMQAPMQPKN